MIPCQHLDIVRACSRMLNGRRGRRLCHGANSAGHQLEDGPAETTNDRGALRRRVTLIFGG